MKYFTLILLALGQYFILGCTTLEVPAGTILSPEVSGRTVELGVASQQSRVLYLTEPADENNSAIPTRSGSSFRGGAIPSYLLMLNFANFLAIGNEPGGLRLQLQLLGESRQNAKPGNISFSVFAGNQDTKVSQYPIALANPSKFLVSSGTLIDPQFNVNSQIAGAIIGYRPSPSVVIGVMYYKQKFKVALKGTIRDISTGAEVDTPNSVINNETIDTGIGIPLFFGGDTFAFEVVPTYITITEPIMKKQLSHVLTNMKMSWSFM